MAYIAIFARGYTSFEYEKEVFARNNYELRFYEGDPLDTRARVEFAREAAGIMVRDTPIGDPVFKAAKNLKAVVRYGVGYDNIDVDAATAHGVKVANVQGYGNHSVSDHALAMIYACARGLPSGERSFPEGFGKPPFPEIFELHDKTIGIIGLGRIGGILAEKARHLFKRVLAVDPYIEDEKFTQHGAEKTDLDTLLAESHVISLHCNLTDETRHIINAEAIEKMKKCPVLVNTARGPVIDENALPGAIDRNQIHSAGIDVYKNEPADSRQEELISHPRIITTGHYAWYSESSTIELQKRATHNMLALLKGEIIEDCLNP